ncbi:MAG: aminopeptidase [Anaerolineae bacterium]|nr:aminopeptidase [Anaerolineae bacterium]
MMKDTFLANLEKYAEVLVRVGMNIQPGQRLLITSAGYYDGAPLESAPLARLVARKAYQAGAVFVDVEWGDETAMLIRHKYAPRDSFDVYPEWKSQALLDITSGGDALLAIMGQNPDLLAGQDQDLIALEQKTIAVLNKPARSHRQKHPHNWCIATYATPNWAAKVFPHLPQDEQVPALWEAIFKTCRIDLPDSVAAWQAHIRETKQRGDAMTAKAYRSLHFNGPGTDLKIGLPEGHIWMGGSADTEAGFPYVANIPTEEIFTLPHRMVADGHVTATKPLSRGGALIDDFSVSFEGGKVVKVQAKHNEGVLTKMIAADESAGRLGEVALVPHSSPISQSGLLFYTTLFDENASCHIALGSSYRECLAGGAAMSDEAYQAAGGNDSLIHTDFMIGSDSLDVDGIKADGSLEPVMRAGEWAFDV